MPFNCKICKDEKWVCENHREVSWEGGNATCCRAAGKSFDCGAGAPCKCNPLVDPNFKEVIASVDDSIKKIEKN